MPSPVVGVPKLVGCLLPRGKEVGTDLQMGVMQSFSLIQLLALSISTMLLADKEGWRAAALARGTAIIPGAWPALLLHV